MGEIPTMTNDGRNPRYALQRIKASQRHPPGQMLYKAVARS